jgi:hypothetical protein
MVTYGQSGYIGSSLSCGAAEAYASGERPISEWSKDKMIQRIIYLSDNSFTKEDLHIFSKEFLAQTFLYKSSWHHTSKFANETDFFSVDEDKVNDLSLEQLRSMFLKFKSEKKSKKDTPILKKGSIKYRQWEGSSRHGKFVTHEEPCIIINNWCYLKTRKKDKNGNNVISCETYSRAPKGTAQIYKEIRKTLPKKYL